ncbi:MAG: Gfo/Idh/MocA family oxidoreductase [Planctomycetales bacterium]
MNWFSDAVRTFKRIAAGRSVGTPVSLQLTANLPLPPEELQRFFKQCCAAAVGLLGRDDGQVYAQESPHNTQTVAHIDFGKGRVAMLSVGAAAGSPLFNMTLIGTQGVAAWEPDPHSDWLSQPLDEVDSDGGEQLLQAVQRSLNAICPVKISDSEAAAPATIIRSVRAPWITPGPPRVAEGLQPPYGLLLVGGAGTHQEGYARSLNDDDRVKLIGVADEENVSPRRQELNEQLARDLAVPLLPDLAEALARDDVHIVSVCVEPERRGPVIVQCANAGKHLYLDKPLCASPREADAILAATRQQGVVAQMYSFVHTPWARRIKRIVDSGSLGELTSIHCNLLFAKGAVNAARPDGRKESVEPDNFEAADSKRELYNIGIYPTTLLFWLLQRPVQRVYATTANCFFNQHRDNDMEDFAQVMLEFDKGLTATLCVGRTGWSSHPSGGVNQTYLVGSQGSCCVDAHRPRIEVWSDKTRSSAPDPNPEDPMSFWRSATRKADKGKTSWRAPGETACNDAARFLDCLESGSITEAPVEIAAAATEVLLAAYRSAKVGQPISLPLPRPRE